MASNPKRGEIWLVDLEPTRGSELQKIRPAVVLSANSIRSLSVHVVVPLTGWQEHFDSSPWKVRLEPDKHNKLTKSSAVDCLQIRCLSLEQFASLFGVVPEALLEEIIDGVKFCLEA